MGRYVGTPDSLVTQPENIVPVTSRYNRRCLYTTPGAYTFTVPSGVSEITAVAVGPGGKQCSIIGCITHCGRIGGGYCRPTPSNDSTCMLNYAYSLTKCRCKCTLNMMGQCRWDPITGCGATIWFECRTSCLLFTHTRKSVTNVNYQNPQLCYRMVLQTGFRNADALYYHSPIGAGGGYSEVTACTAAGCQYSIVVGGQCDSGNRFSCVNGFNVSICATAPKFCSNYDAATVTYGLYNPVKNSWCVCPQTFFNDLLCWGVAVGGVQTSQGWCCGSGACCADYFCYYCNVTLMNSCTLCPGRSPCLSGMCTCISMSFAPCVVPGCGFGGTINRVGGNCFECVNHSMFSPCITSISDFSHVDMCYGYSGSCHVLCCCCWREVGGSGTSPFTFSANTDAIMTFQSFVIANYTGNPCNWAARSEFYCDGCNSNHYAANTCDPWPALHTYCQCLFLADSRVWCIFLGTMHVASANAAIDTSANPVCMCNINPNSLYGNYTSYDVWRCGCCANNPCCPSPYCAMFCLNLQYFECDLSVIHDRAGTFYTLCNMGTSIVGGRNSSTTWFFDPALTGISSYCNFCCLSGTTNVSTPFGAHGAYGLMNNRSPYWKFGGSSAGNYYANGVSSMLDGNTYTTNYCVLGLNDNVCCGTCPLTCDIRNGFMHRCWDSINIMPSVTNQCNYKICNGGSGCAICYSYYMLRNDSGNYVTNSANVFSGNAESLTNYTNSVFVPGIPWNCVLCYYGSAGNFCNGPICFNSLCLDACRSATPTNCTMYMQGLGNQCSGYHFNIMAFKFHCDLATSAGTCCCWRIPPGFETIGTRCQITGIPRMIAEDSMFYNGCDHAQNSFWLQFVTNNSTNQMLTRGDGSYCGGTQGGCYLAEPYLTGGSVDNIHCLYSSVTDGGVSMMTITCGRTAPFCNNIFKYYDACFQARTACDGTFGPHVLVNIANSCTAGYNIIGCTLGCDLFTSPGCCSGGCTLHYRRNFVNGCVGKPCYCLLDVTTFNVIHNYWPYKCCYDLRKDGPRANTVFGYPSACVCAPLNRNPFVNAYNMFCTQKNVVTTTTIEMSSACSDFSRMWDDFLPLPGMFSGFLSRHFYPGNTANTCNVFRRDDQLSVYDNDFQMSYYHCFSKTINLQVPTNTETVNNCRFIRFYSSHIVPTKCCGTAVMPANVIAMYAQGGAGTATAGTWGMGNTTCTLICSGGGNIRCVAPCCGITLCYTNTCNGSCCGIISWLCLPGFGLLPGDVSFQIFDSSNTGYGGLISEEYIYSKNCCGAALCINTAPTSCAPIGPVSTIGTSQLTGFDLICSGTGYSSNTFLCVYTSSNLNISEVLCRGVGAISTLCECRYGNPLAWAPTVSAFSALTGNSGISNVMPPACNYPSAGCCFTLYNWYDRPWTNISLANRTCPSWNTGGASAMWAPIYCVYVVPSYSCYCCAISSFSEGSGGGSKTGVPWQPRCPIVIDSAAIVAVCPGRGGRGNEVSYDPYYFSYPGIIATVKQPKPPSEYVGDVVTGCSWFDTNQILGSGGNGMFCSRNYSCIFVQEPGPGGGGAAGVKNDNNISGTGGVLGGGSGCCGNGGLGGGAGWCGTPGNGMVVMYWNV